LPWAFKATSISQRSPKLERRWALTNPYSRVPQHTNPDSIDADFRVQFAQGTQPDLQTFCGAKAALEKLLGRGADWVERVAVRNPCVLSSINRNREAIYSAS
jgi:hypothetical protein